MMTIEGGEGLALVSRITAGRGTQPVSGASADAEPGVTMLDSESDEGERRPQLGPQLHDVIGLS